MYVIVDLETTGTDPINDQILEIVMVLNTGKPVTEEPYTRISGQPADIDVYLCDWLRDNVGPTHEHLNALECQVGSFDMQLIKHQLPKLFDIFECRQKLTVT